jgi:hypothetical protein
MNIHRGMHMKADLVDGICDVRAHQHEVLKGADNAAIECSNSGQLTIIGRCFGLGVNRCARRLAISHAGAVQKISNVAGLVKMKPFA